MTQNNYLSVRHANFWRLVYLVVFLPLEKSFQQKHLNFSERQRCWKKFILKLQENEDINFLPFLQHYTELTHLQINTVKKIRGLTLKDSYKLNLFSAKYNLYKPTFLSQVLTCVSVWIFQRFWRPATKKKVCARLYPTNCTNWIKGMLSWQKRT